MSAQGYRIVRYADDFVILCADALEARRALDQVHTWTQEHGLTLHPDKTHVGDCRQVGQGFDFLGYRFENGQRRVRAKSLQAIKDKIRAKTGRTRGESLARIVADLNPMLKGWFGYFKHAHRPIFHILDGFVRRRLRALLRRQHRLHGRTGRSKSGSQSLAQCLLRCAGSFHHDGSPCVGVPIPMRKRPTGGPCAGDPLARFGGRGGKSLPYPYLGYQRTQQAAGNGPVEIQYRQSLLQLLHLSF